MLSASHILIADDQPDIREALRLLLKMEGMASQSAASPAEVMQIVEQQAPDCILMDLNYARDTTSGREGLDLLARLRQLDETIPVVVMTAWGSIELAVECMRRGARDFVQKPWDNTRLLQIIRVQTELSRALRCSRRLEAENRALRDSFEVPSLIAQSSAMRHVLELVHRIGPANAPVLITGENGTGKGVVARALHAASSREKQPLVSVNMGGFAESLFESELFGHTKGAFTDARTDRLGRFELADGGTLFLDEIANIPTGLQSKLLRVLETGEFERLGSSRTIRADVRLISATNADLEAEVNAGRFRRDLLFRLNTVEIHLPPLRERPEDIPLLAEYFLLRQNSKYRKSLTGFSSTALSALQTHGWPGNVRELEHAVERAVLMASGKTIQAADLLLKPPSAGMGSLADLSLEEVERLLIRKALERTNGNVQKAAGVLGLTRSSLYRRLDKYGITSL